MSWIVRTITSPGLLACHLVTTVFSPEITATSRIEGIGSTDQETVVVLFGQNTNVIVTILLRLSLHQTELRVSLPGIPLNPLLKVLRQVREGEVVDHVPGSNQEGRAVLSEQFEVVRVGDISNEGENIICGI